MDYLLVSSFNNEELSESFINGQNFLHSMTTKFNNGNVIYAFEGLQKGDSNPSSKSPKEHKFLRYLFGTYEEIEGLDQLRRHVSDLKKNTENKDWLLVRRNGLDMLRSAEEALDEYKQAKEDVDKPRFDLEFHGTIAYNIASIPLAILVPYLGIPLLVDSTVRTSRMAFRYDPPVGLVGTVREAYQLLKNK